MLINATNITITYPNKTLFKNADFIINESDKIGLIGKNGAGKSSLIKAIIGEIELDNGSIVKKKDLKIGYLPQNSNFNKMDTILDTIKTNTKATTFECESMLNKFGLINHKKLINELSGGEIKRLALAIALIKPVDLLILDEPTNHLDIWMIDYLEKFLIKYNKALLLVTHDRYFLENITKKIIEIDNDIYTYDTNYSGFLIEKAKRLDDLKSLDRKLSALYRREAAWASLNPQARTTKSKERLEKFYQLSKDLTSIKNVLNNNEEFELSSLKSRMGKTTIEISNISKTVGNKVLFRDFSYIVSPLDRLGIVGKNGAGKTTFIKTIIGKIRSDSGNIVIGKTIKIGYFEQIDPIFDEDKKVIDYLKEYGEYVDTTNGRISASALAENYLFTKEMQYQSISRLSGGEKRRLQLLRVLITNPNILFLDEPTNDLDIYTLDILETYLETFCGAVIVISHDRYFLDKVASHLLVIDDGNITRYNGIVSDYIKNIKLVGKVQKEKNQKTIDVYIPRFTSQEKKEFSSIDYDIELLENKLKELDNLSVMYSTDYQKLIEINNEKDEINNQLEEKLKRWEYLYNLNDEIEKYRKNKYNGGK